jgi:hypothetical protein
MRGCTPLLDGVCWEGGGATGCSTRVFQLVGGCVMAALEDSAPYRPFCLWRFHVAKTRDPGCARFDLVDGAMFEIVGFAW